MPLNKGTEIEFILSFFPYSILLLTKNKKIQPTLQNDRNAIKILTNEKNTEKHTQKD